MMEFKPEDIRNYAKRSTAIAAAGLALVAFSGCGEDEPTPNPSPTPIIDIDRDDDGAPNALDPYPDVANPTDWDADRTLNNDDLYPYDRTRNGSSAGSGQSQQPPTGTPGSGSSTQKGCPADKDCDTIPDYKDVYPSIPDHTDSETDPSRTDSDDDGLMNKDDLYPNTRDRDGDGRDDGYDDDPNDPNVK